MKTLKKILLDLLYVPSVMIQFFLIGGVRLYQLILSPILPPLCRFHPTCSVYFIQAIQKKGLFKGFFMGVWRILRCNPFCKGGYDPVEEDIKEDSNRSPLPFRTEGEDREGRGGRGI